MKRVILTGVFMVALAAISFAQSDQTESLTINTYYPAPYGVYKTMRLVPANDVVPAADCEREGETAYHANNHDAYICRGSPLKWRNLGSAMKVFSGYSSPDQCNGTLNATFELCDRSFYQDIVFSEPFNQTPHVMVLMERLPDPAHGALLCAKNETDAMVAYPENITATGFRIVAGGSPKEANCGALWNNWWMRALVKWLAIGE